MVGTIALPVSIVSYGNQAIKNGSIDKNYLSNTIFEFCRKVVFIDIIKIKGYPKPLGKTMAANPNEWFEHLLAQGCTKLVLFYLPPKNQSGISPDRLAGFIGGGGSWLIEAVFPDCVECWTSKWKVTHKEAPDRKIWTVTHAKIDFETKTAGKEYDLSHIKDIFESILKDISDFAREKNLDGWEKTFTKARKTLQSHSPNENYYHGHLIVNENHPLAARQLLYSAGLAWVFGGMGSWNDLGFSDQKDNERYNKLTSNLFRIIRICILAATNTYV